MPWMMALAVGGSALLGASASKSAAKTQAAAADRAAELQAEQFRQTREDQAPYRAAGYNALAELQRTAGNVPGAFKFGAGDYQADPGYAFRLSEGQKALDRQAYNRALTGYNTGVASENQLYNRQAGLAGIGQTATNLVGQAGQNYATSAGNLMTGAGAAQAAGQVGMANAFTGGLGTYMNYSQNQAQNSLLQQALNRNRGTSNLVNFGGSGSGTFGEGDY